jgi:hypothetical protein
MRLVQFLGQHHELYYVFEIIGLVAAAWVLRKLVFHHLSQWARRTVTTVDDELVLLLDRAVKPLLILGVVAVSLNLIPLSDKFLLPANRILKVLVIAVALYYGAKVVQLLLGAWLSRSPSRSEMRESATFVTKVLFVALGLMIVLENLGVSLTAVWTTLGVGSVGLPWRCRTLSRTSSPECTCASTIRCASAITSSSNPGRKATSSNWAGARPAFGLFPTT